MSSSKSLCSTRDHLHHMGEKGSQNSKSSTGKSITM